jgi:hypothetical protein
MSKDGIFFCVVMGMFLGLMLATFGFAKYQDLIHYIRCMRVPPCDDCKNCTDRGISGLYCSSESYLEHMSRLDGMRIKHGSINQVRGTRFCKFKERK